jgi:integrase
VGTAVEAQADLSPAPIDALQSVTLAELVRRYRDTVTVHKIGHAIERVVLNAFLRHPICRKTLSGLRAADFAAYRDERLTDIKISSLRRQLGPIRHLFEIARDEWGLPIKENPVAKVRLKGVDGRRDRRLHPGELERLMGASQACRNGLIAPIIQVALTTAMRRGEILSIRRTDIDFERRTLLIRNTKNGYSRTIPLMSDAIQTLLRCDGQDRLFPLTPNAFRLAWDRVTERAGSRDLHFHDLRHEAISRLFEIGLNSHEVALISGASRHTHVGEVHTSAAPVDYKKARCCSRTLEHLFPNRQQISLKDMALYLVRTSYRDLLKISLGLVFPQFSNRSTALIQHTTYTYAKDAYAPSLGR